MPKIKFGIDGAGVEGEGFNTETPPAGTYTGVIKRAELSKVGPGKKSPEGTPMIRILVEITGPPSAKKYHGCGIFRNLVVTEAAAPFVNQWLNAMTDGSETACKRVQKAFWDDGPYVNEDGHFIRIGPLRIDSPEGKREVVFTTKLRTYEGQKQADIARFLTKKSDEADEMTDAEADAAADDDLDMEDPGLDGMNDDVDSVDDDVDVSQDNDDEPVSSSKGKAAPF